MMFSSVVKTTGNQYHIYTGNHILEKKLQDTLCNHATDRIFLLVDENVARYHQKYIDRALNQITSDVKQVIIPEGESSKSMKRYSDSLDFLLKNGVRRNTPIIVIGGGVTGDLGGFVAATALRGIPLIHIPTTLLSMVDSAIGGKTGINHTSGKNLIGSFYQPSVVISDIHFLSTLPQNEWINGLSEVLKYGAIHNGEIFTDAEIFLEDYHNLVEDKPDILMSLIDKCVKVKAEIVGKDEMESGVRAFLNYGHTFAHALEKAADFHQMSHGEAVFLGMLGAEKLSILSGASIDSHPMDTFRPLYKYRVPKDKLSLDRLMDYMQSDKKRTGANLTFVLLNNWQHPAVKTVVDRGMIESSWMVILNEIEMNQK